MRDRAQREPFASVLQSSGFRRVCCTSRAEVSCGWGSLRAWGSREHVCVPVGVCLWPGMRGWHGRVAADGWVTVEGVRDTEEVFGKCCVRGKPEEAGSGKEQPSPSPCDRRQFAPLLACVTFVTWDILHIRTIGVSLGCLENHWSSQCGCCPSVGKLLAYHISCLVMWGVTWEGQQPFVHTGPIFKSGSNRKPSGALSDFMVSRAEPKVAPAKECTSYAMSEHQRIAPLRLVVRLAGPQGSHDPALTSCPGLPKRDSVSWDLGLGFGALGVQGNDASGFGH